MVAKNPRAPALPAPPADAGGSSGSPLKRYVDRVVRYERAPHLARSYQLSTELAAAAGMFAPLDEEPPEPAPEMQQRLSRAIAVAARSIRVAKAPPAHAGGSQPAETKNFRVDPGAAYRAKQLIAQGKGDAEIRRLTGLGRKALLTIRRGESPRSLSAQAGELGRCPDCGGLVALDAPCLLCEVRAAK